MGYTDLYMSRSRVALNISGDSKTSVYMLGVPFDSTTSYRPGTRFGPDAIREALANIEFNSIMHDEDGITLEDVNIVDLGNLKSTTKPDAMVDMLSKVMGELRSKGTLVTVLGGEHLLTLGAYTGMMNDRIVARNDDYASERKSIGKDTMLVVFDAHFDLRDEFNDCRLNHATYLRRIVEDNGNDGSNVLHIGARGYGREEIDYAIRSRMNVLPARDILFGSSNTIGSEVKRRITDTVSSYDRLYISIDLDAIDPAFAPGVGTPEPFGLHPLHLLEVLTSLVERDKRITCLDVVELCPPYDNGITAVLAAKMILEMILMYVRSL
ncbi:MULTISPECIES: agmatinase [Candidatus Nitrosocaldus]|jgi:agmatinase|uniref:Agmatinase n=1 Tax=Candidatus Nitrosocaldus cavascurensis TaxID=2058097 RepID=A0A2K5AS51_9ARCH|nr:MULTISPECIES: agmatinase [Candidatus Nitrosocaldus]SPC34473.1 Agmatinase [Candidatus Nitrosocaldus cavascurensis]